MYDPQTVEVIRSAPRIGDVELDSLAESLTDAYAQIVSLRLQVARGELIGDELRDRLLELRRLANAYEAYALSVSEAPGRDSAAFIAATAHHLMFRAQVLYGIRRYDHRLLSAEMVSSEISAMLLFVMAGYHADAGEVARSIVVPEEASIENEIVRGLVALAVGQLPDVRVDGPAGVEEVSPDSPIGEDEAVARLWNECLRGIAELANVLRNADSRDEPLARFEKVQRWAVSQTPNLSGAGETIDVRVFSAFPGPHHLATLLSAAGSRLVSDATVRIPSPPGLDGGAWRAFISRYALGRPYQWPNHADAVRRGLLDPKRSAVVSFPTGAGKSAIAELKTAATLLRGRKVIYLAPTNALVGQILSSLRSVFHNADVSDALARDGFFADLTDPELPEVGVMTPERCLAFYGLYPDAFAAAGLVIFDECHLLHPAEGVDDRRSLDAMLCLLTLISAVPGLEVVLMSAMMSNAQELAEWLENVTGDGCLALDGDWKPTRQARGCLVFRDAAIRELKDRIASSRTTATTKHPSAQLRRSLSAEPFGFFGLQYAWVSRKRAHYSLVSLAPATVTLGASVQWELTANKNEVAAEIGAELAKVGVKTLVFVQNTREAVSLATRAAALMGESNDFRLTLIEEGLLAAVAEEFGGQEYVIAPLGGRSVVHHSLLLPAERHANESVFARNDGVNLLVCTPTLAQGMNLPTEAVIVAGHRRFSTATQRAERLGAHELLNAAGRAGRAGHRASGLVLVVPDQVVSFDADQGKITGLWRELADEVFSKSDQCLRIEDPIGIVLDHIVNATDGEAGVAKYFLTKLPIVANEPEQSRRAAEAMMRKSLSAYLASKSERVAEFEERVGRAIELRDRQNLDGGRSADWMDEVSSLSGFPIEIVQELNAELELHPIVDGDDIQGCIRKLFRWIEQDPSRLRRAVSEAASASALSKVERSSITAATIATVRERLLQWMRGHQLRDIERELGAGKVSAYCSKARYFLRDFVREMSYLAGLYAQVHRARLSLEGRETDLPLALSTLAPCVRAGVDSPEKLALYYQLGGTGSRVACHRAFDGIAPHLRAGDRSERFQTTMARVREAMVAVS